MATEDQTRKNRLNEEWGVKMGQRENLYLEDQRGPRLMEWDSGADPAWFRSLMQAQRLRQKDEEYRASTREALLGLTGEQVDDYFRAQGDIPSPSSPESVATPAKTIPETPSWAYEGDACQEEETVHTGGGGMSGRVRELSRMSLIRPVPTCQGRDCHYSSPVVQ